MSYEGSVQVICENGHLEEHPYCYGENDEYICTCGSKPVWTNSVNDTNCDAYGHIPVEKLAPAMVKPPTRTVCPTCQHEVWTEAIYRKPTPEETKAWRCYWDDEAELAVPIER